MNLHQTGLLIGFYLAVSAHAQLVFQQEHIEQYPNLLQEKTEAVFEFTNAGEEPVRVVKVASSCGCTVPELEKSVYQPGETGQIKAVFTHGGRVGSQHKSVTVQTDSKGRNNYTLQMVTHIPEWVDVEPRILRWRSEEPVQAQSMLVEVADPGRIELSEPSPSENFNIEVQQRGEGKLAYLITPKSLARKVTEFIHFEAVVREGDNVRTRQFGIHCLIR